MRLRAGFRSVPPLMALVALLAGVGGVVAQENADKRSDGRFTGIAIITEDLKWYELFNKPEIPQIRGQDAFGPGDRGALAIIFSNAEPRSGTVKVECDITALDPNGSSPVVESGVCYEGPYAGDNILHPAMLDLQFEIGENDPVGRSGFEITLRDVHSRRSVDLRVTFTQGSE